MSALVGEVVPDLLLGCVIRVGLGRVVVRVIDFLLNALLSFGSFALAADISSLATCLAVTAPKFS